MDLVASRLRRLISRTLAASGIRVTRSRTADRQFPVEFSDDDRRIVEFVTSNELTMVSRERLFTTLMACQYVARQGIPGDFVECGVWRGGNSIVAADVFRRLAPRKALHLFDTFAGMTAPSARDVDQQGVSADAEFIRGQRVDCNEWCYASIAEVKANFAMGHLGQCDVHYVKGDVLETLRLEENVPDSISVLRLDTDWYESTKLELEVLYPRLVDGGVLIVDDYGHWGGAKQAVDEYFANRPRPFLQYTDYTGRVAVKVARPQ